MDKLSKTIRAEIDTLPIWCIPDGRLGSHEWVNHYIPKQYPIPKFITGTMVLAPYQICKHCHKRSTEQD